MKLRQCCDESILFIQLSMRGCVDARDTRPSITLAILITSLPSTNYN
jgi:hypothetical protein